MESKKRGYFTLLLVAINFLFSTSLAASGIEVEQASVRETIPGAQVSAAYMVIKNRSKQDALLVGVNSQTVAKIEMHEHRHEGGMMAMRKVSSVVVPAQGEFVFKSGGHHMMLMDLEQPLSAGEKLDLQLLFQDGESLDISAPVVSVNAGVGSHPMSHSKSSK